MIMCLNLFCCEVHKANIVTLLYRNSTVRFVATKPVVEKAAPQTVLLDSGKQTCLAADHQCETIGRLPLLQDPIL